MLIKNQRWRIKPPFGSAEIDWRNPLTRELVVALVFNEGAGSYIRNLAQPHRPGTAIDPAWGVHPQTGVAFHFNNVDNRRITIPHTSALDVAESLTVITRASIPTAQDQKFCSKGTNGLQMDYDGSNFRFNADGVEVLASFAIATSSEIRQFAAIERFGSSELFVNGASVASGSFGTTNTADDLTIGNTVGGSALTHTGFMSDFWLYGRELLADEIRALYHEPYAILKPRVRRVYAFVGEGAAAGLLVHPGMSGGMQELTGGMRG